MNVNESLQKMLSQYPNVKLDRIIYAQIPANNMDYVQLGRLMAENGRVLQTYDDDQTYIIAVRPTSNSMNEGVVAICLTDNTVFLAVYAREGLIKQHLADKIVQRLTGIINP